MHLVSQFLLAFTRGVVDEHQQISFAMHRHAICLCVVSLILGLGEFQAVAEIRVTQYSYGHGITVSTAYSTYDINVASSSGSLSGGSSLNLPVNETLMLTSQDVVPPGANPYGSADARSTVVYQPAPRTLSFSMGGNATKFYGGVDYLGGEGAFDGHMSLTFEVRNDPAIFSAGLGGGNAYADLILTDDQGNEIFAARGVGAGGGPSGGTRTLLPGIYSVSGEMAMLAVEGREGGGGAGFGFSVVPEVPSGLLGILSSAVLVVAAMGWRMLGRRSH